MAWYGWLNLFGLLVLWALYVLNHKIANAARWERRLNHTMMATAFVFVVTGASGRLAAEPPIVLVGLGIFLLGTAAWEILSGLYMIAGKAFGEAATPAVATAGAGEPPGAPVDEDGYVDLDAGTPYSDEGRERLEQALRSFSDRDATGEERLRGVATLLSGGEEPDEADVSGGVGAELFALGLFLVVLGYPCWLAVGMF